MKRQQRVVWSKGMLLSPQHFQAQEQFVEDELRLRSILHGFETWGIRELEIDEGALANRQCTVRRCSGLLPDGLAFSMPGGDPLPAGRDFHSLFPSNESTLQVHLALPERRVGERNVSFPGGPSLRFTVHDEAVADETDGREETISVARPSFRLLFGGESADGLTILPIARIQRGRGGIYQLDQEYIPPCVNVGCAPYFWNEVLQSLLDRMVLVSHQLTLDRSERSKLIADFSDTDIQRFWVLHLVNRAIPELQHIVGIGHAHPEDLYRFLLRLGGALCTFSPEYQVTGFPAYDHRALGLCLIPTTLQIRRMLETMTFRKRRCQPIDLGAGDSSRELKAILSPPIAKACGDKAELYLGIQEEPGGRSPKADEILKVLGRDTVAAAETSAGLELLLVSQAPADCARRDRTAYFRLVQPRVNSRTVSRVTPSGMQGRTQNLPEQDSDLLPRRFAVWEDILKNEEIRIYFLDSRVTPAVHLMVVLPLAI